MRQEQFICSNGFITIITSTTASFLHYYNFIVGFITAITLLLQVITKHWYLYYFTEAKNTKSLQYN